MLINFTTIIFNRSPYIDVYLSNGNEISMQATVLPINARMVHAQNHTSWKLGHTLAMLLECSINAHILAILSAGI